MRKVYYINEELQGENVVRQKIDESCEVVLNLDNDIDVLYDLVDGLNRFDTLYLNSLDEIGYSILDVQYILGCLNDAGAKLVVDGKMIDIHTTLGLLDDLYYDKIFEIRDLDRFLVEVK